MCVSTATLPSKPKVGLSFVSEQTIKCSTKIMYFILRTDICFLKGNLTKHMKSKAHGKKCLEMGVSESSVDELDTEEAGTVARRSP